MFKTKPVQCLHTKNTADLKKFILNRAPIQVNGLIDEWPALKWNFEGLSDQYGARIVKVLLDLPNTAGFSPVGKKRTSES